eukprot:COSAG02_NODE_58097_length_278_cov_0.932961_1_plen_27_part_10
MPGSQPNHAYAQSAKCRVPGAKCHSRL